MFVYNDYELLYLINDEGSEQAFDILYKKYDTYIWFMIHKYMFKSDKQFDLYQEALLVFNRCIKTFHECFNVSFCSYLSISIVRRFTYLKKDKYYNSTIFLNYRTPCDYDEPVDNLTYYEKIVKRQTNEMGLLYFEDCIKSGNSLTSFAKNNNISYYEATKIKQKVLKELKKVIE